MKALPESSTAFVPHPSAFILDFVERETRFELATLALARRCSTTELLPLSKKTAENRSSQSGGTKCTPFCTLCLEALISPLVDLNGPIPDETGGMRGRHLCDSADSGYQALSMLLHWLLSRYRFGCFVLTVLNIEPLDRFRNDIKSNGAA